LDISIIKKLLTYGVNISTYNAVNVSVLCGHLNTVKYLIEVANAPYSNSALNKAIKGGHYLICEYLLTLGLIPQNKAISYVAVNNKINIFELLLKYNAVNIEIQVIYYVIKHGRYDILNILFDNKNITNKPEIWKIVDKNFEITWEFMCGWR
jgi:hypothetical protein